MPVKKTTSKKTANNKKPTKAVKTTKKSNTKKPTKKHFSAKKNVANKKVDVIVETKKTNKNEGCSMKSFSGFMKGLFVILLLLNLLFAILNFAKKDSAIAIEEMKVGGPENLEKVMELYSSDFYKEQQTAAIDQFMAQPK